MGDQAGAAEQLTVALRLDRSMQRAAFRLCDVLARGVLKETPRLDDAGLTAALAFQTIDRDLIAAAGMHHLAQSSPLRQVLQHGNRDGWDVAARRLCVGRTHDLLKSDLFLALLSSGIVVRRDIELLLTAVRRVLLLELPTERLKDDALCRFTVALLRQGWNNEFIWRETNDEKSKLGEIEIAPDALLKGDAEMGKRMLLSCLFRPVRSILNVQIEPDRLAAVAPAIFRDALIERMSEETQIVDRGAGLTVLSALSDEVSRSVAGQYEASPYPRWTSVPLYPEGGGYIEHIKTHFKSGQLAFAKKPFEVLIAGCGTGRQAVSAAFDYGPNASVLGVDITKTSLGYASLMAERMGAKTLTLARGDLNAVLEFEPSFIGRFHVIECGGVLHHMADPFAAWKKLVTCLAPGGIMLIGLYSSTARKNLQALKVEPSFPGAGASDDALRTYRNSLYDRTGEWPGAEYLRSRDAYSMSGFRDFFLHVNEHTTSLAEIKDFLGANGLSFRGFVDLPIEALRQVLPGATSPGDLSEWEIYEAQKPRAFAGMYQFWCTKE